MESPGEYRAESANVELSYPENLVDGEHGIQQITYREGPIEASELRAYN